jgi:hypothetical protein
VPATRQDVAAVAVLVALALVMYSYRAQESPPAAAEQPMRAAVDLLSARAGHDTAGRLLPVFVQVATDRWVPPAGPYTTWAITTVTRARQPARRSAALFGALGVSLTYVFGMCLFRERALGWIAAVLLLTNPAYLTSARSGAADGVWAIPTLLISLIAAAGFAETRSGRSLAVAAAALTACVYTQPSGAIVALIVGVTLAVGFRRARLLTPRDALTAVGAAAAAAVPIAFWFILHPSSYVDTLGRWFLHPAYIRHPWSLAIRMMNWTSLSEWASIYWSFFDPTRLLYGAGAPGSAGTFLMPLGVFLAVAGYDLAWPERPQRPAPESALLWIVAVGFAASPLVPASFSEPDAIEKALTLPLFGTILCAFGVRTLWMMPPTWARVAVLLLLGLAGVQFVAFYSSVFKLAA